MSAETVNGWYRRLGLPYTAMNGELMEPHLECIIAAVMDRLEELERRQGVGGEDPRPAPEMPGGGR